MDKDKKIGVLGAGMMGAEIALCFAKAGYPVAMKEVSLELASQGKQRLAGVLDKAIKKGKFPAEEKEPTLGRIKPTEAYEDFEEVDLVAEAIIEDFSTKQKVFEEVDRICKPECIFATNTSSIPITHLASCVQPDRRPKFVGAHFFSPASVMQLVEVIPGLETSDETVDFMMSCCKDIGKTPIRVKDVPGFVVNRVLHAMWIEAKPVTRGGCRHRRRYPISGVSWGLAIPLVRMRLWT